MFFSLSLQAKGAIGTCIDPDAMLTLCIGDMVSLPTKFLREAFVRPKYRGRLCESLAPGSRVSACSKLDGSCGSCGRIPTTLMGIPFLVYRRICNFIKLKCDNDSLRITNPSGRQSSHAFCSPYHPGILIHLFCPPTHCRRLKLIQTSPCSIHSLGKLWPAAVTSL